MASVCKRTSYSRSQVVQMLFNDSDSEDFGNENDSESDATGNSMSSRTLSPDISDQSSSSESSDSSSESIVTVTPLADRYLQTETVQPQADRQVPARGRGRRNNVAVRQRPYVHRRQNIPVNPQQPHRHLNAAQAQVGAQWEMYDDMDPYSCDWLPDFQERTGVLVDTSDYNPVDYFYLYFPSDVYELMANETNRYARQFLANQTNLGRHSRFNSWEDTDPSEMKAYVALQIAMGLCQKHELADYWEKYWLTSTPFTDVMSKNRYLLLCSFIHFADNSLVRPYRGELGYDALFKIRNLMNICEPKLTEVYAPRRDVSIDESIIKFKGRVSFRQYLPSKPTRWGIKQYALCEAKSGYGLKFMTYLGKGTLELVPGFSITESICLRLMDGYLNKGHIMFTDNYYSSPALFKRLEQEGTGACGTVKAGRQGMPRDLHPNQLVLEKRSDPVFMRDSNLVACAWHDTKRVHFISTISTNNTVDKVIRSRGCDGGRRVVEKPVAAETYNQSMGGVDIMDQKLGTYAYPHKCSKWYHTIYHRCREVALVNAYILYEQDKGDNAITPKVFRQRVIDDLIKGFIRKVPRRGRPSNTEMPTRLTERHFVGKYTDTKFRPDCVVCSDRATAGWKRKQTCYNCKQCNVPMCCEPCHEIYHTHKDFKTAAGRIVHGL